jgi:thymidine kinase
MYSGKTSEIIREYYRQISIERNVLCINYKNDTRYGLDDFLYSHNLTKIPCIKVSTLAEIDDESIKAVDCVLINEGQFFGDLVEYVKKWCDDYGKDIIVSGLDGDYKRAKFGSILDLIPLSDSIEKIPALCIICKNGTPAIFTHRISNESEQIVIGTTNYIPVCRTHYLAFSKDK